jgi:hypothetical protein
MRTSHQRNVEAIVDEHARACPARGVEAARNDTGKRGSVEIAFADLNEIDTGTSGSADRRDERVFSSIAEAPPV